MQDLNRILDKEAIMTLAAVRYVYVPSNEVFWALENKQHGSIYVVHQGDGTVIVYRVNRDGLPERVICRDYAAQVFLEDFPEPEEKIAGALGYCQRTGEMRVLQWDYGTGTGTWELIAWNSSVGDARPESPDPGRTWYDPVTESYLFYTGAEWKQLALGNIGEFLATRDETQALMDATQQLHDGALQASASANSAKDTAQQASASANSAMQRALQSSSSAASYAEEALQHSTTAGQHKDTASAKAQEAAEDALAADASARASAESSEKALQYRDEAQALAAAATLAEEAATGALGMVATHLSATQDAAGQAAEDRALAESAKADALSAKDTANSAALQALSAKNAAVDAKNATLSAKDTTLSAKDTANSAALQALSASADAESARDQALDAKDAAVDAKNATLSARDATLSAKDTVLQARDEVLQERYTDIVTLTGASGDVSPGGYYDLATSGAFTLGIEGAAEGKVGFAIIDIVLGTGGSVTGGTGLEIKSELKTGKLNRCFVVFKNSTAELWAWADGDAT